MLTVSSVMTFNMLATFAIALIAYWLCKKCAEKPYQQTGYNALNGFNRFLMVLIWVVQFAFLLIENYLGWQYPAILTNIMWIIVGCVWAILIYRNRKLKNPVHIIIISLLQLYAGIGWIAWGIGSFLEKTSGPRNSGASGGFSGSSTGSTEEYTQYQVGYKQGLANNVTDPMQHNMSPDQQAGFKQGRNDRGY